MGRRGRGSKVKEVGEIGGGWVVVGLESIEEDFRLDEKWNRKPVKLLKDRSVVVE